MIIPIVLSGGSGSRLWPLSRELNPKQFQKLDSNRTLFQQTLLRLEGIQGMRSPIVVCNAEHRFTVAEQLNEIDLPNNGIFLEQSGRNTLPALGIAAMAAQSLDPTGLMLVLPADHLVGDIEKFQQTIENAMPVARSGKLVCFGVRPTHPETGYGYIQCGDTLNGNSCRAAAHHIRNFREKPDKSTAQEFVRQGDYFWNSGIFLFGVDTFLSELRRKFPSNYSHCYQAFAHSTSDYDFKRISNEHFKKASAISIDEGILEGTSIGAMVEMKTTWSDVGTWTGVWDSLAKTADGNVVRGDVCADNVENSCIISNSRLVAAVGLKDIVVVETEDAVLVVAKEHAQSIKNLVSELKSQRRTEVLHHTRVNRPWGYFESLEKSGSTQVKRLVVNPGARLSLQRHQFRSEHWVVVSGQAQVRNGDLEMVLSPSESTFIPAGVLHQLENCESEPLEVIEVQTGTYFGEDDIERFEDDYGRVANQQSCVAA